MSEYGCEDWTCPYYEDGVCTLEDPTQDCDEYFMQFMCEDDNEAD